MLEDVKIETIELERNGYVGLLLITVIKDEKKTSFLKYYGDGKPCKISLMEELITDGSYVKEGYRKFYNRFSKFLSVSEMEDYYKRCIVINKKLKYLFGDYVHNWGVC